MLHRRGDIRILVGDVVGDAEPYVERLEDRDCNAEVVDAPGLGVAAAGCDVVILEASVASASGALCGRGSRAAAAAGAMGGAQVWLVVGEGRAVAPPLFEAIVEHEQRRDEPWHRGLELVPGDHVHFLVGPTGRDPASALTARVDGPEAPELLNVLP